MLSSPVVGAAGAAATGEELVAFSRLLRGAASVETGNKFTESCGVASGWTGATVVAATGSGGGALVRWRKDMASADTTNSRAMTAPASFHCVTNLEGIFSTLPTLAGAGSRVMVVVADGATLVPEEAVGNGGGSAAAAAIGGGAKRGSSGEGAETT